MADALKGAQQLTAPRIVLTFAGPGAAECTIQLVDVQMGQLFGAAWLLDQVAREQRAAQQLQEAQAAMAAQAILRDPRRP